MIGRDPGDASFTSAARSLVEVAPKNQELAEPGLTN